jgi:hypothetical protein
MAVTDAPDHPLKMDFIFAQLSLLGRLAEAEQSLSGVEAALDQAQSLFAQIPRRHEKWNHGSQYVSFIMAGRYMLTRDPVHLKALVGHVLENGKIWNTEWGWTGARVHLAPAEALQTCLDALSQQPHRGATATATADTIYGFFAPAYKASGPTKAALNLYCEHGPALERLCRPHVHTTSLPAAEKREKVTGTEEVTTKKDLSIRRRPQEGGSGQFQDRYRDPLTGLRYLAPSASGRVIVSVEPVVRDIMGYQEGDPEPPTVAEFLAREARLEAEALQRERENRRIQIPLCAACAGVRKPSKGRKMAPLLGTQTFGCRGDPGTNCVAGVTALSAA